MPAAINVTISELQSLMNYINLSSETRLTLTFEDENSGIEVLRRKKAFDALKKLKNSGNGNLINVLLGYPPKAGQIRNIKMLAMGSRK